MGCFVVDPGLCRKDGICAQVCPIHIIKGAVGEYPTMEEAQEPLCIGCGQCMAFCPANACAAPGLSAKDCPPLQLELLPSAEQMETLAFSRRSVRNFKKAPVPRALLARLLDATRFAPTAKNSQNLRWIVLESREQTEALAKFVVDWARALPQTDPTMGKAVHAEGLVRAWDRGIDVITRSAPQVLLAAAPRSVWGASDAAIAATYFELLAHAHKVGCCWGGYVCLALGHAAGESVRAFLGIARDEHVYAVQMVGFPQFVSHNRPPRKPLNVTWL